MTIEEVIVEAQRAVDSYWFVQRLEVVDRTDATVTLHFHISPLLFVQLFLSQRRDRISLALIGPAGRLYGRDREHGDWHRHPFGNPTGHEPTPDGVAPVPISQFLSEVEQILVENDLL